MLYRAFYKSKITITTILAALVLLTVSCGEDRTYEYVAKTEHCRWIQEQMMAEYLWGDSIKDVDWKGYFANPTDFMKKMTAQSPTKDPWSYVTIDTLSQDLHERGYFNHLKSYGIDFTVMADPTGETSRQYARVITVYPNSPADRCKVDRGCFIGTVNGNKITSNNTKLLVSGREATLEVATIDYDEVEGKYYWETTSKHEMGVSEKVEDEAFPVHKTIPNAGKKVAYLMATRLVEHPYEVEGISRDYRQQMLGIMSEFKSAGADELVLDLRLCNDGTLAMAHTLASCIVPAAHYGDTFVKTLWREDLSMRNETLVYDKSFASYNPAFTYIYIITGEHTQGAAEWLIHGLQATCGIDGVQVLGTKTKGQNVMLTPIKSTEYHCTLYPATAYVADAAGEYGYADGIVPDVEINEYNQINLYPYGDRDEAILKMILK